MFILLNKEKLWESLFIDWLHKGNSFINKIDLKNELFINFSQSWKEFEGFLNTYT